MKIRVSEDLNVVRILFQSAPIDESEPLDDNFIMDYDADGNLVGIEVMSAREVFGEEQFARMRSGHPAGMQPITKLRKLHRRQDSTERLAAA